MDFETRQINAELVKSRLYDIFSTAIRAAGQVIEESGLEPCEVGLDVQTYTANNHVHYVDLKLTV